MELITINYEAADMLNSPDGWSFNYCWRNSGTLQVPAGTSDATITRRVKEALELSGRHYILWNYGDDKAFRLSSTCVGFNWRVEC